jgi:hypothetical protein
MIRRRRQAGPGLGGGADVKTYRFRAIVTLDATAPTVPALHYPGGLHAVMVHACRRDEPSRDRYFPAGLCRDDERPLGPGDHALVTITVTDDEAECFLGAGQHFTLWTGGEVGHGIISRRAFTLSGPC